MVRTTYLMTSFVLAVLLAGLGLASLWHYLGFRGIVADWHWVIVEIDGGNLQVGLAHWAYRGYLQERRFAPPRPQSYISLGQLGRIVVKSGLRPGNWRYISITVPLWTVVTLLFVHPAIAFIRGPVRRRRRHRRNQCVGCGYDRTGNTSGVCPECGSRFECSQADRVRGADPSTCDDGAIAHTSAPPGGPYFQAAPSNDSAGGL